MNKVNDRSRRQWWTGSTQLAAMFVLAAMLAFAGAVSGCDDDPGQNDAPAKNEDAGDALGDAADADAAGEAIRIDGLSAPLNVQIDTSGVVHIDCQTNNDCFAAQGYFHARHRFIAMDLIRHQTRGQLSEMIGSLGLDSDKLFRHVMTTRDGRPLEDAYLEQVDEETRQMLDAYAAGVNAWLADVAEGKNGAALTLEYEFPLIDPNNIRPWEPQDTIALYLQLAYQLSETAEDDLFRAEMLAQLEPEVAADLFTVKPGLVSNTMQASGVDPATAIRWGAGPSVSPEALADLERRLHPALDVMAQARGRFESSPSLVFGPKTGEDGSNNWAVAPELTRDGKALLADDPHLSLNNPAIWHMVELDSQTNGQGDLHVAGASVPAVPGVVIGHNEHIGWGVTTARLDLADAYIEELTEDGSAVIHDGQEVELLQKDFTFELSDGGTETVTYEWVPHHGPLISKDLDNRKGVSIRWVAQEPGADINFLLSLLRATNVDEAMQALEPLRTINQNWVIADADGSIGWSPRGAIPNRPFSDSELPNWLPLPGDGSAEWDGYLAAEDAPKMVDPPANFIATANNDMDGSYSDGDATNDGHSPWQSPPAFGHRHKRIVDLIEEGGDQHTVDTMHAIQADTYVLHAEVLLPHLLQVAQDHAGELDADVEAVVAALDAWQYTCPTGLDGSDPVEAAKIDDAQLAAESIGCSAFHVMLPYLTREVFGDEVRAGTDFDVLANWPSLQAPLIYIFDAPTELSGGQVYFDNVRTADVEETRDDVVLAALATTAAKLDEVFESSEPDDWRWGRIHTVTFRTFLNGITAYNNGPFANDGGFFTVDVANPAGRAGDFDDNFNHPNGPSVRVVFEVADDGVSGWFQLPGGQDHHRESALYGSLVDDWLSNTPTELLYDRDEVDAAAVETYAVQPAQ